MSLPFSDHCEPLVGCEQEFDDLLTATCRRADADKYRYLELRPLSLGPNKLKVLQESANFRFHTLDLRPTLEQLFANFHKDCVQRKIRRANRARLECENGSSHAFLDQFYEMFVRARRSHGLPPQPKAWFRNLIDCFGEALKIRLARNAGQPVAAILTIQHKDSLVYKYGCSDPRFNNLGGTFLLFWNAIQEAKQNKLRIFDLGRSDCHNNGLITFKNRLGATSSALSYWRRYGLGHGPEEFKVADEDWKLRAMKTTFPHLHPVLLSAVGNILYKHIG